MSLEEFSSESLKFASLMAHQLRSPLSAVSQAIQAVLGEYAGPVSTSQRGTLERASDRCNQAMTAVRRMLTIIHSQESGEADLTPSLLAPILRQVHLQYVAEATRRDIELMVELDVESVYVRLGEPALVEILIALLDNAMKYTPDHGRVRIATRCVDDHAILLSVADSGIGIDQAVREQIFEPFFRSKNAKQSGSVGVGLGLAFVQSMVTVAGGHVRVETADIGGAEFVVEIPLADEQEIAHAASVGDEPTLRVVIVGGVAAGPKAGAKIIRLHPDADVTVVDKGSVLSYSGCGLPYYVSGVVREQKMLISSPAGQVRDPVFFQKVKNVHVMNQTEALEIDRARRRVRIRNSTLARDQWLAYDKLLLATGSTPVVPSNLDASLGGVFTLHGVRDAEGIRAMLSERKASNVVIVGGGLIGIEMTEALTRKGARVTVIERLPRILPRMDPEIAGLVEKHLEDCGVRIVTNTPARSFQGDATVSGVVTDEVVFPADMVILAIGVSPQVSLARDAGLSIGSTGAIQVDERMQTSDPDIYAAGDCVQTLNIVTDDPCYVPMGSTANKQARVAAINICGGEDRFPGVLGSCVCKVFDYCVARTGLGEEEARNAGIDVLTVLVPGPDREHFAPGVGLILMKLVVDAQSRRLLGVQATGPGAVDKRIDVAAMAITSGMTVDDVAHADLCYGPPYSPAMDNLITASNVARNMLDGHVVGIKPRQVHHMLKEKEEFTLLDVRTPDEHERVRLQKAQLIPLGALRGRLGQLPRDQLVVTFCDISLRGYEAALILQSAGFTQVKVMEGGLAMWPYELIE
jgi:NADPH-dependent 2,4-dienoyl-CoA reductase/sulfur reductase-like enzyme/rhodanese-related sulfurtransferase/two-component sensor histidine kinase